MRKFKKKPVVIEAVQITASMFDGRVPNPDHIEGLVYDSDTQTVTISTLEGEMVGRVGDWIVKGVKGEYYPCKPDIFAATYESVEAPYHIPATINGNAFWHGKEEMCPSCNAGGVVDLVTPPESPVRFGNAICWNTWIGQWECWNCWLK
jgi:hypothetical protein